MSGAWYQTRNGRRPRGYSAVSSVAHLSTYSAAQREFLADLTKKVEAGKLTVLEAIEFKEKYMPARRDG